MIPMATTDSGQKHHWILDTSKHPLVILLVGAVIGSVVVPRINSRIEREKRQQGLRAERGTAILKSAWETERKLNLLKTAFESFYRDQLATGKATTEYREALRDKVYALYQDFDRDAWWWHWQVLEEVKVLKLVDDARFPELDRAVHDYHDALLASTRPLDRYWDELIRRPELVSEIEGAKTLSEVGPQLVQLGERRRESIRQMVQTIVY